MTEPVIIQSGYIYDKKYIIKWLDNYGTDPITKEEINDKTFIKVILLYNEINEFLSSHEI